MDPEVQLMALRAHATQRGWQVVEEFVDRGVSGARERRPALDRLMKRAWAGHFQVVLVWRFDRLARSVKHLVAALETFRSLQVEFVSLQEQLDLCICVHAEQNALLTAARFGIAVEGATVYTTMRPCFGCGKELLQAKVKRVVYRDLWTPPDPDPEMARQKLEEYTRLLAEFDDLTHWPAS